VAASSLLSAVIRNQEPSVIDDEHLGRMTLGDRRLEREVLEIFARQINIMLTRIAGAEPSLAAAAAHTLKGSACGIGAWRMARAAERLECVAAGQPDEAAMREAADELEVAAIEVSAAIDARLGDPPAEASRGH
jgi:HPt (histidine-containing phosphotransfer) domain-containing protein